jgi:hypothetical protein
MKILVVDNKTLQQINNVSVEIDPEGDITLSRIILWDQVIPRSTSLKIKRVSVIGDALFLGVE